MLKLTVTCKMYSECICNSAHSLKLYMTHVLYQEFVLLTGKSQQIILNNLSRWNINIKGKGHLFCLDPHINV